MSWSFLHSAPLQCTTCLVLFLYHSCSMYMPQVRVYSWNPVTYVPLIRPATLLMFLGHSRAVPQKFTVTLALSGQQLKPCAISKNLCTPVFYLETGEGIESCFLGASIFTPLISIPTNPLLILTGYLFVDEI